MMGVSAPCSRLGHVRETAAIFRKMLWLNPAESGVGFCLEDIESARTYEEGREPLARQDGFRPVHVVEAPR